MPTVQSSALAGQIEMIVFDFDGVFTDNRVLVLQDGSEGVLCSRADGFGLEAVRKLGIHLLVISKEKNPVVGARCKKLKLRYIQRCDNKAEVLKKEADRLRIPLAHIAFIGNDINDIECLEIVGLPVCVADSHPDVLSFAKYITRTKGGYGAVREFCDFVVKAKKNRDKKAKNIGSKL
jgi:3-deoxy-D-manno-octulosonate 8-phosphate phosphatase (KDO 8-P phosphatase)